MTYDPTLVLNFPWFSGLNAAGNVPDRSGRGNDFAPNNFVGDDSEFVDSNPLGQAVDLDGINKRLDGADTEFPISGFDRTLLAYVTPDTSANGDRIFAYGTWAANQAFHLAFSNATGGLVLVGHTNNYVFTGSAILRNFNQIGVVVSSGRIITYLNGLIDSNQASLLATVSNGNAYIGKSPDAVQLYDGLVNRIQMFSRAMGAAEIHNRTINARRV